MKNRILKNWKWVRVLRLVIGLAMIRQAIWIKDYLLLALGGLFTLMPVLNIGCCCASGNCSVPPQKTKNITEDVEYEEVR